MNVWMAVLIALHSSAPFNTGPLVEPTVFVIPQNLSNITGV